MTAHEPGQMWEYSNTNYQILGRVIEVASGQEYQSYVTTNDGEIHESIATGHALPFALTLETRPRRAANRLGHKQAR